MSHVSEIKVEITSLDALERAAAKIGCELVRDKTEYKWFGFSVGDYPLPTGFSKEDLGKCEHVIKLRHPTRDSYEVGVVTRRDGKPGYVLHFDHWNGGYGLVDAIGKDACDLVDRYAAEIAIDAALASGMTLMGENMVDGKIELLFQA